MTNDPKALIRAAYLIQRAFPEALNQHIERERAHRTGVHDALDETLGVVRETYNSGNWLKRWLAGWFYTKISLQVDKDCNAAWSRMNNLTDVAMLKTFGVGLDKGKVVYWCRTEDFASPRPIFPLLGPDDSRMWQTELKGISEGAFDQAWEVLKTEVQSPHLVAWAVEAGPQESLWITICWKQDAFNGYNYTKRRIDTLMQQAA